MLYNIFSIIAPVFLCALIGYTWVKKGVPFETAFVSTLVMNVGAPCLIFSTFMDIELERSAFLSMAGAAFITMVIFALFCVFYMKQKLSLDFLWAGLCLAAAAFFMFRGIQLPAR